MGKSRAGAADSGGIGRALQTIGGAVPGLELMGLACWMAWNSIAFSGSFWLHDITDSLRSENLIVTHLVASIATLVVCAAVRPAGRLIERRRTVWLGAALAVAGSVLIVVTREALLPSRTLFNLGCVLSGVGTTALFLRAAPLLGALPPRRSLMSLMLCSVVGSCIYFYLHCCPNEVATVLFALLPAVSAALYSVRGDPGASGTAAGEDEPGVPRKFAVFLCSVCLCSMALEVIRAYILIEFPPSVTIECSVTAYLLSVPLMLVALVALVLAPNAGVARAYPVVVSVLVVLLSAMGAFSVKPVFFASLASLICTCFNLVVWSMLAYIVFQSRASAVRVLGLGNAMLSLGTVVGGVLAMAYQASEVSDATMRVALAVLGAVALVDVLFVFNERQISLLLLPIDESLYEPAAGQEVNHKGRFVQACEALADERELSAREKEVLVALARGQTAQEFAEKESLSIYTVRAHIRSVYAKFGVHSSKELRDQIKKELGRR